MIFWCVILIVFAFLSYAIDYGTLPYTVFRHLWNILLLGLGVFLFLRIKGKESQGYLEHLEIQINDLYGRIERKQVDTVWKKMDDLDSRIRELERKQ